MSVSYGFLCGISAVSEVVSIGSKLIKIITILCNFVETSEYCFIDFGIITTPASFFNRTQMYLYFSAEVCTGKAHCFFTIVCFSVRGSW